MSDLTVAEIAGICEGKAEGDTKRIIRGANSLESALPDELSFAASIKATAAAAKSRAGCLLVSPSFDLPGSWSLIRVTEPRSAFARALASLYPKRSPAPHIHPTAIVAETATLAADCSIGPYVVIGEGTLIGKACVIGSGVHIGERVRIGDGSALHPHVTLYDNVRIGSRVIIHAGCVIGADGFGFAMSGDHYEKFPQIGTVEIEDDVELGANCCVDRAALGVTRIGAGSKLDNLVHIAHNCDIGKHVVIAAQTGFAGGVTVGDYAILGGQVGIGEKAIIAPRAIVGSKGGILNYKRVEAGEPVWGIPARPLRRHLRDLAHIGKVPKLLSEHREFERRLSTIESQLKTGTG